MTHDWRVETFVQSIPNPGWSVRVVHVPTGATRTVEGKGGGWRRAAGTLQAEMDAALDRVNICNPVDGTCHDREFPDA